ncbi:hypothetical protein Micbo1qcDRAFT_26795 [Microdochium bolleyi]|uniref:Uncharacterized protein n=1 Tax=Microdochium bolleyi TaxID=196109 RepID=A0A136JEF4_9PEZI|nr:hypothetical protein Micbo1qcDRAFT_26795 [Microdochium bolleyi]
MEYEQPWSASVISRHPHVLLRSPPSLSPAHLPESLSFLFFVAFSFVCLFARCCGLLFPVGRHSRSAHGLGHDGFCLRKPQSPTPSTGQAHSPPAGMSRLAPASQVLEATPGGPMDNAPSTRADVPGLVVSPNLARQLGRARSIC